MISLQALDIFFCIRYDYLQDQNSAGSLFNGLMFCTQYAFLPAFLRFVQNVWKANAGIFSWSTQHAWIFFHLIFPCMNFFLYFARPPPPLNFSNGPSLSDKSFSLKQIMWFKYWFKMAVKDLGTRFFSRFFYKAKNKKTARVKGNTVYLWAIK